MNRTALPLAVLLAAGACSSTTVQDVEHSFRKDYRRVLIRTPSPRDPEPARAENDVEAMESTVEVAERFLKRNTGAGTGRRYVRALLASALLLQGRSEEAHGVIADIRHDRRNLLSRHNEIIQATRHAAAGCYAVRGRILFEEFLERRMSAKEYLVRFGGLIDVDLPTDDLEFYPRVLRTQIARLEQECFQEVEGDPRGLERVSAGRRRLRAMLSEQIYNDAAALLVALPEEGDEPWWEVDEWLGSLTVSLFIVCAIYMDDMLPHELGEEQKQWQREQAFSVFDRLKTASRRFISARDRKILDEVKGAAPIDLNTRLGRYRRLYQRLLYAATDVQDRITLR